MYLYFTYLYLATQNPWIQWEIHNIIASCLKLIVWSYDRSLFQISISESCAVNLWSASTIASLTLMGSQRHLHKYPHGWDRTLLTIYWEELRISQHMHLFGFISRRSCCTLLKFKTPLLSHGVADEISLDACNPVITTLSTPFSAQL